MNFLFAVLLGALYGKTVNAKYGFEFWFVITMLTLALTLAISYAWLFSSHPLPEHVLVLWSGLAACCAISNFIMIRGCLQYKHLFVTKKPSA